MIRFMEWIEIRLQKTAPYLPSSIDVMAVGNLPNELPRDASRYFGEQLIKYILDDLVKGGSGYYQQSDDCFKSWRVDEAF